MGLIDELPVLRVCIDTAPFIYYIEKHQKYLSVIKPVFVEIDAGKIEAITSTFGQLAITTLFNQRKTIVPGLHLRTLPKKPAGCQLRICK